MIIYSAPLHHPLLPSCTKSSPPGAGAHFRRHKNLSLSNHTAFQSLPMTARHEHLLPPLSAGSNVSEDTDDMYDDLFEKYGKVVFKRNDQKSVIAEVDDDAESLSFAVALAKVASDVKAADIKLLFVKPLVYWTRFFIIATAFSRPQVDAIGSRIRNLAETEYGRTATGDFKPNSWTLLDFGDVVVHIFLPPQRDHYNLEEFYANATPIELPFQDQQPFRN
ncbi:protein Iojap, chloroplastic-like isoform X1 [Salvia splendens]|uniref:protein Iojap, chloroplastic-like isoform X1 n=2 Tax=Salvia splendens TaxID=180675 RepID=UPI001C27D996|nr:protein Iojap, chloroplastic-like isoform X1 [Salvia splendens]